MNFETECIKEWRYIANGALIKFALHGVFAGLLLSGFIVNVPHMALGIGCAVYAGIHLMTGMRYQAKLHKAGTT